MKTTTGFSTSNPMFRSVQMLMVPFSYVPNFVKSERSQSTSQEASDVSLRELKEMAPNQKVNVHATLSMGAQEPNKIETKSSQALSVKEDCILEDETGTMELHIWEPLFTQLKSNKAYYFQNLTLQTGIQLTVRKPQLSKN